MASPIPDFLIAAYFSDGEWKFQLFQLVQVVFVFWCASSSSSSCTAIEKGSRRCKPPKPPPSSQTLKDVLGKLCSSKLGSQIVRVEQNLHVRFRKVSLLSSYRVDDRERFGRLAHWSLLVERTRVPNIVVYYLSETQFWVVCANARLTHEIDTRSAICWLREGTGMNFCVDAESGVVYRIEVSRRCFAKDAGEDPWSECLAHLLSSVLVVFPASTSDEK